MNDFLMVVGNSVDGMACRYHAEGGRGLVFLWLKYIRHKFFSLGGIRWHFFLNNAILLS